MLLFDENSNAPWGCTVPGDLIGARHKAWKQEETASPALAKDTEVVQWNAVGVNPVHA